MKRFNIFITAILTLVLSGLTLSCSSDGDEITVNRYLKVNYDSFSFDATGTRTFTVTVSSNSNWEVTEYPSWVTESASTSNSFSVSTTENTTDAIRAGTIVLSNEDGLQEKIYVSQGYILSSNAIRYFKAGTAKMVMSANGQYAAYAYSYVDTDETSVYIPTLIDLKSGEVTTHSSRSDFDVRDVANNGTMAIVYNTFVPALIDISGYTSEVSIPTEYASGMTSVEAFAGDPSTMVGYVYTFSSGYQPCRWDNGNFTLLNRPNGSPTGQSYSNGTMARGCSSDGNTIYGSEWTDYVMVVWSNGDLYVPEIETVYGHYFMTHPLTGMQVDIDNYPFNCYPGMAGSSHSMSYNGRYIATFYNSVAEDTSTGYSHTIQLPYIYDTQNKEGTILTDYEGYSAIGIDDTGTYLYCRHGTVYTGMKGYVYNMNNATMIPTEEWVLNTLGVVIPENSRISRISEDGKSISGIVAVPSDLGTFDTYWVFSID